MRDPRVARYLKPFGFNTATLENGWNLFFASTEAHRTLSASKAPAESSFSEMDRFEARWVPVARIVLDGRYPEVAEKLFAQLGSANGKVAEVSVAIFLDRFQAMAEGAEPFGEEGPIAREYLRTRGLTDEVVAGALAEKDEMKTVEETTAMEPDAEAAKAAEAAMWAFYLEWSALVRHAIKDGNLLRMFGFKKRSGGRTPKAPDVAVNSDKTLKDITPVPLLPAE